MPPTQRPKLVGLKFLHDPNDEEIMYRPARLDRDWIHNDQTGEGYHSNDYTMLAPAGSFKLKIQFWDGTYLPSFYKDNGDGTYGTTSFDDADTITITKTAHLFKSLGQY